MEAFVAALRNLAIGDRLSAALQFLAAEGFADEVVIAAVLVLVDPTFDAANATLKEIKGIANVLRGAVETDRELDVASLKDMRVRAAEEFAAFWKLGGRIVRHNCVPTLTNTCKIVMHDMGKC